MKTYLRGEIISEFRGDLGVAITSRQDPDGMGVFIYPVLSKDFDHITGVRSVKHPLERVYLGLGVEATDEIARNIDYVRQGRMPIEEIDSKVIIPFFLKKS